MPQLLREATLKPPVWHGEESDSGSDEEEGPRRRPPSKSSRAAAHKAPSKEVKERSLGVLCEK